MMTVEMVRGVVAGLSGGGKKEVSNALIYQALGLETEPEKARCRSRIENLLQRKELERISPGKYRHTPKPLGRYGDSYVRMWRAARSQTKAFDLSLIQQISHVSNSTAGKYVKFLESERYLRRAGKRGNIKLYAVTAQGRNQRETPFPPLPIKDPFATQRSAMSRLARIFFEKDLYAPRNGEKIVKECEIILARFKQDEKTVDENSVD